MELKLLDIEVIQGYYKRGEKPTCAAEVGDISKRYRDMTHKDYQCERLGRYVIDGKPYCSLHAGELAVHHLLTQNVLREKKQ